MVSNKSNFRFVYYLLAVVVIIYFFIYFVQYGTYSQQSNYGGKLYLAAFGFCYLTLNIYYIIAKPKTYGFILIVSGVVIYDSFDSIFNLVLPHIVFSVYLFLWIFFFFYNKYHLLIHNKGQVLLIFFCISTFISALKAENQFVSIGYTFTCIYLFLFSSLSVSFTLQSYKENKVDALSIVGAICIITTLLSSIFVFYETLGKGISIFEYIQINYNRNFTGNLWMTAGFMEPAGYSIAAAIFGTFIIVAYFFLDREKSKKHSFTEIFTRYTLIRYHFLLIYSLFYWWLLFFTSGSRSSIISTILIFLTVLFVTIRFSSFRVRLNKKLILFGIVLMVLSSTILIYRSASIFNSFYRSASYNDTTSLYLVDTYFSFKSLMENFWGNGALNSNLYLKTNWSGYLVARNLNNLISNLFVIGTTYGWLSMALYFLIIYEIVIKLKNSLKYFSLENFSTYNVLLIYSASVFIVSVLPFGFQIGPFINWSPVDINDHLINASNIQPKVYPVVLGSLFLGVSLSNTGYRLI